MLFGVPWGVDKVLIITDHIEVSLGILVEDLLPREVNDVFFLLFLSLFVSFSVLDALVNHLGELTIVCLVHGVC